MVLLGTAVVSIVSDHPERPGARRRAEYHRNAAAWRGEPGNVRRDVVRGVRTAARSAAFHARPYWLPSARYDLVEVLGTALELLDQHDAALPTTVLPPQQDVVRFVDAVARRPVPVDVVTQLQIALPIARGELVGAINLCWISTRLMARGCDRRAYPGVAVAAEDLAGWSRTVAGFVAPGPRNGWTSDASGDTYYFWTHVLLEVVCHNHGWTGVGVRAVSAHGTAIMRLVRRVLVGQQLVSDHREASRLGRLVGRAIVERTPTSSSR